MISLTYDRRLIEDSFPVKEVGSESAKEKSIRHAHPSTLHIWWARRPLGSSRGTCYAALVPAPHSVSDLKEKSEFVANLSRWDNTWMSPVTEEARQHIREYYQRPPRVLDPYAGGGSIPLEAMRLGCETYSHDYNPVSVLIQKCTLEYPQKYGTIRAPEIHELAQDPTQNPLAEDVKRWSEWVLNRTSAEIAHFYIRNDGEIPIGYLWAHTLPCQNPSCDTHIPLIRQYWLAKGARHSVSLCPVISKNRLEFRVVGQGYGRMPHGFNPDDATMSRAIATCPVCGSTIDAGTTRFLFKTGKSSERLIAVISSNPRGEGKLYRIADDEDARMFRSAADCLRMKRAILTEEWGFNPVPDEPTPEGKGRGAERAFSVRNYGLNTWGDLFNPRQQLALVAFTESIRLAHQEMLRGGYQEDYALVISSYLALGLDRLVDFGSRLCILNPTGGRGVVHTFGRQVLPMVWDYFESNPFYPEAAGWHTATAKNLDWIRHASSIPRTSVTVTQSNATSLDYPDDYFDAVLTDPPYYDNIPYSHLSDFFYVWLKRAIGPLYPELFSTPLTPKKNEIVAYSNIPGGFEEGKRFFEESLKKSFGEIYRVLNPNGIAVIVYAHKSTEGWETMLNSLLDSKLVITAAWPINTEKVGRLRSQMSAALASSIYIVARKLQRSTTAIYKDAKKEMAVHLSRRLDTLWNEGIGGADFFIAAIGSAIEVYGKYEDIIDFAGQSVRGDRLLDDVRELATDYAIQRILHNGFSDDVSALTRFYLLFRWNYKSMRVEFDEARKLAQSCGIDLTEHWSGTGFIQKEKEFIRVLGPHERKLKELEDRTELIDVLHQALLLWSKNRREEIPELLGKSGFNRNDAFWRVAQAISETLSIEDKEKKLLDGFLAGRNGYVDREPGQQVTVEGTPTRLRSEKRRSRQTSRSDTGDGHEQVRFE